MQKQFTIEILVDGSKRKHAITKRHVKTAARYLIGALRLKKIEHTAYVYSDDYFDGHTAILTTERRRCLKR